MTNPNEEAPEPRAGRRRLYGANLAQTRSLSLDPDNWTWLDSQAQATGRTRSNVLNRILDDHRRASIFTPERTEPSQRRMITADGSTILPADDPGAFVGKLVDNMIRPVENPQGEVRPERLAADTQRTSKHEWDPTGVRCVRCDVLKRKDLNGRCPL